MGSAVPQLLGGLAGVAGYASAPELLASIAELRGERDPPNVAHALLLLADLAHALEINASQLGQIIDVALVDPVGCDLTRRGLRTFGVLPHEAWNDRAPTWRPLDNAPRIAPLADSSDWTQRLAGECAELAAIWPSGERPIEQAASAWIESMRSLLGEVADTQRARAAEQAEREQALAAELAATRAELAGIRASQHEQASGIAVEVARLLAAKIVQ